MCIDVKIRLLLYFFLPIFAIKLDLIIQNQHEYAISVETRVGYLNTFILIPNVPCLESKITGLLFKRMNT